jgi:DnaJ-class molecular chaperone
MRQVNQKMIGPLKCNFCNGKGGRKFYIACTDCQNEQYANKRISIRIPKGFHDGKEVQLKNRGNIRPDQTRGSIRITINVQPHAVFTRQGDDLYVTCTISVKEALLGFKNKVLCTHLDGRTLSATQPSGNVIKPGSKRQIKGEGMPMHRSETGACGELVVTFQVEFPDTVNIPRTREARNAIDALFETEQETEARENAIIIDDETEEEPPISIPDDDNVSVPITQTTAEDVMEDVPPELFNVTLFPYTHTFFLYYIIFRFQMKKSS